MTTFNTGNPIGSTDARDLSDNAENFDKALGTLSPTWIDRLGRVRDSFEGRLAKGSFYRVGTFTSGYTLTNMRQTLEYGGHEYSWAGTFPKVVAAGATPSTSGGIGAGAWVDRTDVTLRDELTSGTITYRGSGLSLRDFISVKDFGAKGDGVTDDTLAILAALVYAKALNSTGVTVFFPNGKYLITQKLALDSANLRLLGESRWGTRLDSMSVAITQTIIVTASSCDVSNMFIASNSTDIGVYLKGGNNFTSDNLVCKAGLVGILHETGNCSWITKFYAESCGTGYKMAPIAASNCNGSYIQGRSYNCEIGFDLNTNGSTSGPGMNNIHYSCEANTIGFREASGRYNNLFVYSESNSRTSTQGNANANFSTLGLANTWFAGNPSNDLNIIKGSGLGVYSLGGSIHIRLPRTAELTVTNQTGATMSLSDPNTAIWNITNGTGSTGALTLGFMSYLKVGQRVKVMSTNSAQGWNLVVPSGLTIIGAQKAGSLFGAYVTSGLADILTITRISDTQFLSEYIRGA